MEQCEREDFNVSVQSDSRHNYDNYRGNFFKSGKIIKIRRLDWHLFENCILALD